MRTEITTIKTRGQGEYYAQQLNNTLSRLANIHEQGVKALSRYDIEIAHQGDSQEALLTAKHLLHNQVKYFQKKIAALEKDPEQLVLL